MSLKNIIATAPIGIFDSGVGGLSVLRQIRQLLPHEHLLYMADSAHIPYGEKSREYIEARCIAIAEFFIQQQVKAIVIACNTATSAAVEVLRARFDLPIVAMEPAIKPAAAITRSGVVGVLATSGTLKGERFANLRAQHAHHIEIAVQPCPGWVELVEQGHFATPAAYDLVSQYVTPLLQRGADTLVLGCTHYPFLSGLIQQVAGPEVHIIDPSPAVARQLQRRLQQGHGLNEADGVVQFWTSGEVSVVNKTINLLWPDAVDVFALGV